MKRKVVKQGKTALTVTLPSKWAKQWGISAGDEIEVKEKNKELIIIPQEAPEIKEISIDMRNMHEIAVMKILSSLHKYGYDKINITHNNTYLSETIRKLIGDLFIGFTIIEQNKNNLVIKSISKDLSSEFEAILRRTFLIILSIGEDSLNMIKEGKQADLKELIALERVNNQLTNFCERVLNREGYKDYEKTCFIYIVVWSLEKVCDDYKYLCEYLAKHDKIRLNQNTIQLYEKTNNFFKSTYELFYKFDINKLTELTLERDLLIKESKKLYKKCGSDEIFVINYLLDLIVRTAHMFTSIIIKHVV